MNAEIYLDSRTAEQWSNVTRVIPKGFACVELGENSVKIKIGDGVKTYSQLPYLGGDMTEYYTKTEVDSAISTAISSLGNLFTFKGRVDNVDSLPSGAKQGDVYLVGAKGASEFQEYYWTGTLWDYMGKTTETDLTNYYTKTETDTLLNDYKNQIDTNKNNISNLQSGKVDKIDGKVLSTNDYTTAEKNKLSGIQAGANKTIVDDDISTTSKNPLQNRIVTLSMNALSGRIGTLESEVTANKDSVDYEISSINESLDRKANITDLNGKVDKLGAVTGIKGNAETSYRTGNVNLTPANIGAAEASHTHSYLPLSGGTLTGTLAIKGGHGLSSHLANGTAGANGYVKIAQIKISRTYQNSPILIVYTRRHETALTFLNISFANAANTDPDLNSFNFFGSGTQSAYIVKSATSTWDIYVKKAEAYDSTSVLWYSVPEQGVGITLTLTNEHANTLPAGYTQASIGGITATARTISAEQTTLFKNTSLNTAGVIAEIEGLFTNYNAVICNIVGESDSSCVLPLKHVKTLTSKPFYYNGCGHYFEYVDDNTMRISTGFAQSNPKIYSIEIISLY